MKFGFGIIVVLFVIIMGMLGIMTVAHFVPSADFTLYSNEYELVAINNSTQTSGNFFLGCGSIDEESCFYFYTRDKNGAIKLQDRIARFCTVYEDVPEGGVPRVRLYETVASGVAAEFHVPKGSIVQNFTLDVRQVK